jgi:hypothetical protein
MKVRELIIILQKYDPDANVVIGTEGVIRKIDEVDDYGMNGDVMIANND